MKELSMNEVEQVNGGVVWAIVKRMLKSEKLGDPGKPCNPRNRTCSHFM